MRAIATTDFGAPATLVEIPAPEPAEGEILVRVASSSINGFDLSVASGRLQGMMEHRFPVVLGKDFAGTVEAVGAGVDGFVEGDNVFGVLMKPELGDGCFAERIATPAAFAAKVADGLDGGGEVLAEHDREAMLHHPFEPAARDAEVEAVDRAGCDPDEDLAFGGLGSGDLDESGRGAEIGGGDGFHACSFRALAWIRAGAASGRLARSETFRL